MNHRLSIMGTFYGPRSFYNFKNVLSSLFDVCVWFNRPANEMLTKWVQFSDVSVRLGISRSFFFC
jgi:hypothetical protein